MKIIAGMSGGVDSAVAAWALREAGHEVIGLSLILFESRAACENPQSCCSMESVEDAARTAALLGIEHRRLDARDEFITRVIEPFAADYARGMTPNPCILCNRHVKFPKLLEEARRLGAGGIATGHYARVEHGEETILRAGVDPKKDQSYVLYALRPEELQCLHLPLGAHEKSWTRERARALGLPVFNRPESQEICFVGPEGHASLVGALSPEAATPGAIIDTEGRERGRHQGIGAFTLGQRRGLGIAAPEPLYVIEIRPDDNTVVVGPREMTYASRMEVRRMRWLTVMPEAFNCSVKIRSTTAARPARVTVLERQRIAVEFEEPAFAPAPGQSAVLYEGNRVIGGGIIHEARR